MRGGVLSWSGVIYKNAAGEIDLDDVHYRCEHCRERIEERDRPEMLRMCEWRPDNPGHPHRGYQLSALYSPWVRWRELASEWVKAHADRDKRGIQEFVNLRLGEAWTEDSDEITVEALEKNREHYEAEVPASALLLTAGVDVQDNRLEVEIVGWGVGKESWGISYQVIPGDTTDTTSPASPWHRLDALLVRTWAREQGDPMRLWCVCIDSGGHRTSEVYEFCRPRLPRNIFAIKGFAGAGKPIAGKATTNNQFRIPLIPVGVDTAKADIFSRLSLVEPGPGYCHFPIAREAGYDDEFFKGLCSEKRRARIRAGRRSHVWVQVRARNEPLDCRCYSLAAMEMLAPNFAALAASMAQYGTSTPPKPRPRGRGVISRGVEV